MRATISFLAVVLVSYAIADDVVQSPLQAVSAGTVNFSNDLFKQLTKQSKGKNLISSPLSAHIALSLLYQGARGLTAQQMAKSLYLPEDLQLTREGAKQLMDKLNNVENVTLSVANQLYLSDKFSLKKEYELLAADSFSAKAATLDFDKADESAKTINAWVDEKTNHKISSIVQPTDLTADSAMLLLNAIYFKGAWDTAFKKSATVKRPFRLDEKRNVTVDTMYSEADYFYGELPELKAKFIELPYKNKQFSMIIVVPDEVNGLDDILEKLETVTPANLRQKGYKTKVKLYLPKFKIESEIDLKAPLEALGMTSIFARNANFTGLTETPVVVGKAVQKAIIEVNEEGSEAAAVTAIGIQAFSGRIIRTRVFKIDKPFFYEIVDRQTNTVLFAGITVDLQ